MPSTVKGTVRALAADQGHAPYHPQRTLSLRVELVRQLRRRRTQVAFALVALLPVILWIAFALADGRAAERLAQPRRPRQGQRHQLRGRSRCSPRRRS
jgi:hypothetical protein